MDVLPESVFKHSDISAEQFLKEYWQQKPLLIRNAISDFQNPLNPDELAGLSCEEEIESRLVTFKPDSQQWQLQHGPFSEQTYASLPDKNWTLLVQSVDHVDPSVAQLLDYFRFLPNWRLEDIMVSYATTGGSVGPHFDNYDVFLLQGAGQREWQIGPYCDNDVALQENTDLNLLKTFDADESYTLAAGDILYLPPRVAHWGIAKDNDCMTYSIGFRAPSHQEILANFCDDLLANIDDQQFFQDKSRALSENPGRIDVQSLDQIRAIINRYINDDNALKDWFARFMTAPKEQHEACVYECASSDESTALFRQLGSRWAYDDSLQVFTLYVNGEAFPCDQEQQKLARLLCAQQRISVAAIEPLLNTSARQLLDSLLENGYLYYE